LLSDAALVGTPSADRSPRTLLDVGCSTGALLIAARSEYSRCIGVDVAFRWLVLGQIRLREAGVNAPLICANAGHLPFADCTVETVTAADLLEHVRDAPRAVREVARVLKPGGDAVWTTNNRFAPVPEPHVKLWGVGWLPRRWQPAYVARRRRDLLPYAIRLRSARELRRLFERAGFASVTIEPAPLMAPHIRRQAVQLALRAHNRMRRWPVAESLLRALGPRLWVRAVR
jgi:ubiquinone/menaquinone biosynthesis C-methylase UbiE